MLGLFHIKYGVVPAWNEINSDFPNYYTSSKLLLEGTDLKQVYDDTWFQKQITNYGIKEPGKFSPFPPPTFFVMLPLASFSPLIAKRMFLVLNIFLALTIAYLFKRISSFSYIACLNVILLSGAAFINNMLFGQLYLLLLLANVLGYYYLLNGNDFAVGILWGVGAAIKYFPFIFIPVLIIKKKWKVLAVLICTVIIINITAFFVAGKEVYNQFFSFVLFSHLNGDLSGQSAYSIKFQSWNSLLRNLFVYNRIENSNPFFNSSLMFNFTRGIIYILFTGLTSFVIYKIINNKYFYPYSISMLTLLIFVLSPASATYHLLLLCFPLILLLSTKASQNTYEIIFISLYILIGFSPLIISKFAFLKSNVLIFYYHLWLLILFFVVSLSFILSMNSKIRAGGTQVAFLNVS